MPRSLRGVIASVLVSSPVWSPRTRGRMLRALGADVAPGVRIYPFMKFVGRVDLLSIRKGAFLNANILVGSNARIEIGERVSIGPGVQLLPTSHALGPATARAGQTQSMPIRIGDGAWIGAGSIVLGGVVIGPGAVVAAGAVVTRDCEAHSLYGGVPARLIRRLET